MVLYTIIGHEDVFFNQNENQEVNLKPRSTCLNDYLIEKDKDEKLRTKLNFDRKGQ